MAASIGVLPFRELEDMLMRVLRSCKNMAQMMKLHAQIVKFSLSQSNFLVTKMVDFCDKNEKLDYARSLFNQVDEPNNFLCNAMIRAYTRKKMYGLAIYLYKEMLRRSGAEGPIFADEYTHPFVISSCGGLLSVDLGKQVHGHLYKLGLKRNNVIENSLLDLYVKCNELADAHKLFEEMCERDEIAWNNLMSGHIKLGQVRKARAIFEETPNKTIVSWTNMISGYVRIGCHAEALDVFRTMQMVGIMPDWISLIAVLPACAQLGALEVGKWIHFYAEKKGFMKKACLCNALVEMYAKCGSLDQALQLFDRMLERDVVSWSTLIVALANHGRAGEAIALFQEMQSAEVEPNEITFVGLLSACSHAGLTDEGLSYFDSMKNEYKMEPRIEHYGCLVDLLGRTGRLDQALELIKSMPMKPDSAIWGSLLSSCRTHRSLDTAVVAMEHLLELEPDDTGNYVLLANIYADLGKWGDVSRLRKVIRSKSMKKSPGCSMIEVNNVVQEFISGDNSKPLSKEIYWILELLALHWSKADGSIEEDRSQFQFYI